MIELAFRWWCRHFHSRVLRPVCGQYRCEVCLRSWPVVWESKTAESSVTRSLSDSDRPIVVRAILY